MIARSVGVGGVRGEAGAVFAAAVLLCTVLVAAAVLCTVLFAAVSSTAAVLFAAAAAFVLVAVLSLVLVGAGPWGRRNCSRVPPVCSRKEGHVLSTQHGD